MRPSGQKNRSPKLPETIPQDGEMDEYPEAAFFNVGTIEDVKAKAETLK